MPIQCHLVWTNSKVLTEVVFSIQYVNTCRAKHSHSSPEGPLRTLYSRQAAFGGSARLQNIDRPPFLEVMWEPALQNIKNTPKYLVICTVAAVRTTDYRNVKNSIFLSESNKGCCFMYSIFKVTTFPSSQDLENKDSWSAKTNFLSRNSLEFDAWKMWILWKKGHKNVNFVNCEIL